MDWTQILAIVLGNFAVILPLWLWSRGEANSDRRDIMKGIMAETLCESHLQENGQKK